MNLNPNYQRFYDEPGFAPNSNLSGVFHGSERHYISAKTFFAVRFGCVPNCIKLLNINCEKAKEWLENNYGNEIKDKFFVKLVGSGKKKDMQFETYYQLLEDLLILFNHREREAKIYFKNTDKNLVDQIVNELNQIRARRRVSAPEISLLVSASYGLDTKELKITRPQLKIEDNYNDDFLNVHKIIHKRLNTKNDKGLVLLHGKPGTGKTSYIRYLVGSVKKKVIFLPPNLAAAITNPDLLSVLIDEPNSIFVIEDAENIITDREIEGNSPVSALLNLSDGLLSDCLNIQIICSFNTDLSKVDDALLRKGRLIAKYEFKELAADKAQQLSNKLGFDAVIDKPMYLTDIYNQQEINFQSENSSKKIGF